MKNREMYQRARKRVEAKIGFYKHFAVYIVINILFIIININTSAQFFWFQWPLLGWGIGVVFHALGVFVFFGESAIKSKMIEQEMKKEALRQL